MHGRDQDHIEVSKYPLKTHFPIICQAERALRGIE